MDCWAVSVTGQPISDPRCFCLAERFFSEIRLPGPNTLGELMEGAVVYDLLSTRASPGSSLWRSKPAGPCSSLTDGFQAWIEASTKGAVLLFVASEAE